MACPVLTIFYRRCGLRYLPQPPDSEAFPIDPPEAPTTQDDIYSLASRLGLSTDIRRLLYSEADDREGD